MRSNSYISNIIQGPKVGMALGSDSEFFLPPSLKGIVGLEGEEVLQSFLFKEVRFSGCVIFYMNMCYFYCFMLYLVQLIY